MKRFDIKEWKSLNESSDPTRRMTEDERNVTLEAVANFNEFTQHIYKTNEIKDMVENIRTLAENASKMAIEETADWFDIVSVKRDTKSIGESVKIFEATAKEISTLQQRMESVFEDIGGKLGKYYEIKELNESPKLDAVGSEDGDIDNDGDKDASDEFLAKKRAAISKAVANESTNKLESMLRRSAGLNEAFGAWDVVFEKSVVSGIQYDGKTKYSVKARNTSEAIKKAVTQAGGTDSDWMAVDVKSLNKK